jgi:hypothetical protein
VRGVSFEVSPVARFAMLAVVTKAGNPIDIVMNIVAPLRSVERYDQCW